jgi:hypothetical protein
MVLAPLLVENSLFTFLTPIIIFQKVNENFLIVAYIRNIFSSSRYLKAPAMG